MNFIINRKTLILMVFSALTMLGYFSYKQLPVELFPNINMPMLFVQVNTGLEVDPRYMENQAIIPLEGAIGSMEGVERIQSTAGQQSGSIRINFNKSTNTKYAYLKLVEKIDEVKKDLPEEFIVNVFKFDLESLNNMFMTLQVRGSGGVNRVRQITEKEVLDKIKNIDGVANAEIFGGRDKSIEILLNEEVCEAYNISPSEVRAAISSNSRARFFAGKVVRNEQLHFVNVVSEFEDVNDLHELVIRKEGDIRLKDIAEINFGLKERESFSRVNGLDAVTIDITRDAQSNLIALSEETLAIIASLNEELSDLNVELEVQMNMADTMEKNIDLIIELAITGGVLAIFVLWIFLRNFRLVTAIALAIPISVYTAFNFFYAGDISVNSLSLLGMALAIGMLLDNSVVVMENIYRLAAQKMHPDKAVVQGTKEVWKSIVAATLTTITVFLPFIFSEELNLQILGKHIGVSIISTLLVSLVVALFLVPMITHFFLTRRKSNKPVRFERISHHHRMIQLYFVFLKTCMRNPGKTVMGALCIFFVVLLLNGIIVATSNYEPEVRDFTLYATLPNGTTLETTDLIVREAETKLLELEEKENIVSQVFEGEAIFNIKLVEDFKDVRNYSMTSIKNEIMENLEDLRQVDFSWDPPASAGRFGSGGFEEEDGFEEMFGIGSSDEKIILKGSDFDQMLNFADDIKYYVEQLPTIDRIRINIPDNRPELQLNMDPRMLAAYDIPLSNVMSELNSFQTEFSTGVNFKQGTEEYDIRIKTETKADRKDRNFNDLRQLEVKGNQGAQFEIQEISTFDITEGLSIIRRNNQEKQLTIRFSYLTEVTDSKELLEAARLEVSETIEKLKMPSGIAVEIEEADNTLLEFRFLIFMAFMLIYMILAAVFESFSFPIVMLFSIPMAAIGSMTMLFLTGTSIMNPNVLTGFLILLGIVVNNGIIMIDYARVLQKRGYRESRSLMMAGLARVRPILITAITTIIALLPLALGKAEYVTSIGVPFAITVIGGLAVSTLLTLVFIPTLYSGLRQSLEWMGKLPIWIKILQGLLYIALGILIYYKVDKTVWQIINYIVLLIGLPLSIFFIQHSLKQASSKLIGEDEDLVINIRNLVKIYDWDSKFKREWNSGIKIRERLGLKREIRSLKDFEQVLWQLPLIAFTIYFIYVHLESGFWFFVLPVVLYLMILGILRPFRDYARYLRSQSKRKITSRLFLFIYKLFFWAFPTFALFIFFDKYGLIGLVIPMGFLWYLAIQIKVTSDKLYREKVNINRIKGRFKGIRKAFYRFVKVIPIIGKKKVPFKAVKGVSFTIEKGMFGLLGPNGAGKSTLMRIVCGILEQSYGQITINGIDVAEKREELQGLIGYLPQEFGMYENMKAIDFLHYMGILKKLYDKEERSARIEYVLKAVHMYDHRNEKIGSYSGGMKQRIGIAQILLNLPRILVVDEPTAGLDPRERIRFRNLLVELSKERIVIFSTHIIEDVASSCNRVAVIKQGELKYLGAPINMAGKADGKVWLMNIPADKFEEVKDQLTIIHHMRDGDQIRVRCLANEAPGPDAKPMKANLEDAYLSLLKSED